MNRILFITGPLGRPIREQRTVERTTVSRFLNGSVTTNSQQLIVIGSDDRRYLGLAYHLATIADARGLRVFPSTKAILESEYRTVSPENLHMLLAATNRSVTTFSQPQRPTRARTTTRTHLNPARLVVLIRPDDDLNSSDLSSLRQMQRVGRQLDVDVTLRSPDSASLASDLHGVFLRCPNAYWFANRAEQLAVPVIDDTQSIRRCNNKIYVAEICRTRRLPCPQTLLFLTSDVTRAVVQVERAFSYPLILKHPGQSFGTGVFRVLRRSSLERIMKWLAKDTAIAIAQKFLPTSFDWRIGVLDGVLLYACRYHVIRRDWKVVKYQGRGFRHGTLEPVPLTDVPIDVGTLALLASAAFGNGLYGVDIKEGSEGPVLIEVNDNPDIFSGTEAHRDGVWEALISWFMRDAPRRRPPEA